MKKVRKSKATHTIDSVLGGSFDVRVIKDYGDTCDIEIDMPRNPDWHGVMWKNIKKSALTMRRRRGEGWTCCRPEPDASWYAYPAREKAN